jgi:hypothetical protein
MHSLLIYPDDGRNKLLSTAGTLPPDYMTLFPDATTHSAEFTLTIKSIGCRVTCNSKWKK